MRLVEDLCEAQPKAQTGLDHPEPPLPQPYRQVPKGSFFSKRQQEPPRVWKHECASSRRWLVGAHVNLPAFEMWQRRMADAAQASAAKDSAAKDSLAGSPLSASSARDSLLDSPRFPLRLYLPHQRSAETSLKCLLADTRTSPQTQPCSLAL